MTSPITPLVELQFAMGAEELLSVFDVGRLEQHAEWMRPNFLQPDGKFVIAIQTLLVRSQGKTILVDTCMGNDRPLPGGFPPLQTAFLIELEKLVPRSSVDIVLCTHLHFDHIGWNTMFQDGDWLPTFPNARYLFGRREYEHWAGGTEDMYVDLSYAVDPIVRAGLHELVEPHHRITSEVTLLPTPGHTPGHASVLIESRGQKALITGDMVHSPIQFAEPTWSSCSDSLPDVAIATRQRMVEMLKDKDILVIGTHFPPPTAGFLVGWRKSCRLNGTPAPKTAMSV